MILRSTFFTFGFPISPACKSPVLAGQQKHLRLGFHEIGFGDLLFSERNRLWKILEDIGSVSVGEMPLSVKILHKEKEMGNNVKIIVYANAHFADFRNGLAFPGRIMAADQHRDLGVLLQALQSHHDLLFPFHE